MTAIRKRGEGTEILHGHAAVRARKRNPGDWEMFAYPKLVFTDEGTTPDVQRTLDLQKEKAMALGMTSKEIAIAFFRHMISEVIGGRDEVFKIYMNISDRWPNRNVQELMLSLKSVRTDAQFEHVDECLSSIIGRISSDTGSASAEGVYVVIDCGHSGMVCFQLRDSYIRSDTPDRTLVWLRLQLDPSTRSIDGRIIPQVLERSTWPWKMRCELLTGLTAPCLLRATSGRFLSASTSISNRSQNLRYLRGVDLQKMNGRQSWAAPSWPITA